MMKEKEKKAHGVQLLVRAVVRDPDGKIISDTGRKPSKSFVVQFLIFMGAFFDSPVNRYATTTVGSNYPLYLASERCDEHFRVSAPINNSDYGIVVGTGDTAEDNADYQLDTQLTEGASAGEITHNAVSIGAAGVVGANVDLELKRSFTNNTGSTITVKEAGIYIIFTTWSYKHCIIRDVLPAGIDVADKCSLTMFYTLRTTV